jgi:hypothetical protein
MLSASIDVQDLKQKIIRNVVASYQRALLSTPDITINNAHSTLSDESPNMPSRTSYQITTKKQYYTIEYGRDLKEGHSFPHVIKNLKRTEPPGTRYAVVFVRGRRLSPDYNPYMSMNELARAVFGSNEVTLTEWDRFVSQFTPTTVYHWISKPIPVGKKETRIMWENAPLASWWTPPKLSLDPNSSRINFEQILAHIRDEL